MSQQNMENNKSDQKLTSWLLKKVNDNYIHSIYDKTDIKNHYGGEYDEKQFYKYYRKDDIDLKLSQHHHESLLFDDEPQYDEDMSYEDENNIVEIMELYGDKIISHNPSSNIAHTSTLFKQLLDCIERNKLCISIPRIDKTNTVLSVGKHDIIDISMKKAFYEFCKENTYQ